MIHQIYFRSVMRDIRWVGMAWLAKPSPPIIVEDDFFGEWRVGGVPDGIVPYGLKADVSNLITADSLDAQWNALVRRFQETLDLVDQAVEDARRRKALEDAEKQNEEDGKVPVGIVPHGLLSGEKVLPVEDHRSDDENWTIVQDQFDLEREQWEENYAWGPGADEAPYWSEVLGVTVEEFLEMDSWDNGDEADFPELEDSEDDGGNVGAPGELLHGELESIWWQHHGFKFAPVLRQILEGKWWAPNDVTPHGYKGDLSVPNVVIAKDGTVSVLEDIKPEGLVQDIKDITKDFYENKLSAAFALPTGVDVRKFLTGSVAPVREELLNSDEVPELVKQAVKLVPVAELSGMWDFFGKGLTALTVGFSKPSEFPVETHSVHKRVWTYLHYLALPFYAFSGATGLFATCITLLGYAFTAVSWSLFLPAGLGYPMWYGSLAGKWLIDLAVVSGYGGLWSFFTGLTGSASLGFVYGLYRFGKGIYSSIKSAKEQIGTALRLRSLKNSAQEIIMSLAVSPLTYSTLVAACFCVLFWMKKNKVKNALQIDARKKKLVERPYVLPEWDQIQPEGLEGAKAMISGIVALTNIGQASTILKTISFFEKIASLVGVDKRGAGHVFLLAVFAIWNQGLLSLPFSQVKNEIGVVPKNNDEERRKALQDELQSLRDEIAKTKLDAQTDYIRNPAVRMKFEKGETLEMPTSYVRPAVPVGTEIVVQAPARARSPNEPEVSVDSEDLLLDAVPEGPLMPAPHVDILYPVKIVNGWICNQMAVGAKRMGEIFQRPERINAFKEKLAIAKAQFADAWNTQRFFSVAEIKGDIQLIDGKLFNKGVLLKPEETTLVHERRMALRQATSLLPFTLVRVVHKGAQIGAFALGWECMHDLFTGVYAINRAQPEGGQGEMKEWEPPKPHYRVKRKAANTKSRTKAAMKKFALSRNRLTGRVNIQYRLWNHKTHRWDYFNYDNAPDFLERMERIDPGDYDRDEAQDLFDLNNEILEEAYEDEFFLTDDEIEEEDEGAPMHWYVTGSKKQRKEADSTAFMDSHPFYARGEGANTLTGVDRRMASSLPIDRKALDDFSIQLQKHADSFDTKLAKLEALLKKQDDDGQRLVARTFENVTVDYEAKIHASAELISQINGTVDELRAEVKALNKASVVPVAEGPPITLLATRCCDVPKDVKGWLTANQAELGGPWVGWMDSIVTKINAARKSQKLVSSQIKDAKNAFLGLKQTPTQAGVAKLLGATAPRKNRAANSKNNKNQQQAEGLLPSSQAYAGPAILLDAPCEPESLLDTHYEKTPEYAAWHTFILWAEDPKDASRIPINLATLVKTGGSESLLAVRHSLYPSERNMKYYVSSQAYGTFTKGQPLAINQDLCRNGDRLMNPEVHIPALRENSAEVEVQGSSGDGVRLLLTSRGISELEKIKGALKEEYLKKHPHMGKRSKFDWLNIAAGLDPKKIPSKIAAVEVMKRTDNYEIWTACYDHGIVEGNVVKHAVLMALPTANKIPEVSGTYFSHRCSTTINSGSCSTPFYSPRTGNLLGFGAAGPGDHQDGDNYAVPAYETLDQIRKGLATAPNGPLNF
jgi:hypothetical protein